MIYPSCLMDPVQLALLIAAPVVTALLLRAVLRALARRTVDSYRRTVRVLGTGGAGLLVVPKGPDENDDPTPPRPARSTAREAARSGGFALLTRRADDGAKDHDGGRGDSKASAG